MSGCGGAQVGDGEGDWETFEGRVEPLLWGDTAYTILRVPPEVSERLRARGARRIEGEIDERPVNLALSRAPVVEGDFLWAGRMLLSRLGIEPGEPLEVRLRPAPADAVETPEDVAGAIRAAELEPEWEALTPGRQRGRLSRIETAKRAPTRAKRIEALLADLRGGAA